MPKGYWIAQVEVTDPDQYQIYVKGSAAAFSKYNANILVRGGDVEHLEGVNGRPRNVVIEFDSMQQALDCYHSEEYQSAKVHRENAGIADIMIVEGA